MNNLLTAGSTFLLYDCLSRTHSAILAGIRREMASRWRLPDRRHLGNPGQPLDSPLEALAHKDYLCLRYEEMAWTNHEARHMLVWWEGLGWETGRLT